MITVSLFCSGLGIAPPPENQFWLHIETLGFMHIRPEGCVIALQQPAQTRAKTSEMEARASTIPPPFWSRSSSGKWYAHFPSRASHDETNALLQQIEHWIETQNLRQNQ